MLDTGGLWAQIALTWRQSGIYLARRLAPLGLGPGQVPYLLALYEEDRQTQQNLSHLVRVDKSATAAAVDRLVALGYVERQVSRVDRRYVHVHLTARGRAIQREIEAIIADLHAELLLGIEDMERETFERLLRKMGRNISLANQSTPAEPESKQWPSR